MWYLIFLMACHVYHVNGKARQWSRQNHEMSNIDYHNMIDTQINDLLRIILLHFDSRIGKPYIISQFQVNSFLILGEFCVYHSECSGCDVGYSQRCVANRCQCLAGMTHVANPNSIPGMTTSKCILKTHSNPTLVYYDYGNQNCVVEKPKDAPMTKNCSSDIYYNMTSIVDRESYCLNALDMIDTICYDNKMCQDSLGTDKMVGLCYNGICHVMSVVSLESYILNESSCNSKILTNCEELEHQHIHISHDRIIACDEECKTKKQRGVPSRVNNECHCFFPKPRLLNRIEKTLNVF